MAHLEEHYADLAKKPFFPGLVKYMASGPVVAMVWEGLNAVKTGKKIVTILTYKIVILVGANQWDTNLVLEIFKSFKSS